MSCKFLSFKSCWTDISPEA